MPRYRTCPFVSAYILQVLVNNFLAQFFLELSQCNEKHSALTSYPFRGIQHAKRSYLKIPYHILWILTQTTVRWAEQIESQHRDEICTAEPYY